MRVFLLTLQRPNFSRRRPFGRPGFSATRLLGSWPGLRPVGPRDPLGPGHVHAPQSVDTSDRGLSLCIDVTRGPRAVLRWTVKQVGCDVI